MGAYVAGRRVLIVEGVVTSRGQVAKSAEQLRAIGAVISSAICVIDRETGGARASSDIAIKPKSLRRLNGRLVPRRLSV